MRRRERFAYSAHTAAVYTLAAWRDGAATPRALPAPRAPASRAGRTLDRTQPARMLGTPTSPDGSRRPGLRRAPVPDSRAPRLRRLGQIAALFIIAAFSGPL